MPPTLFFSTNRQSPPVNLRDALLQGQAPDRGLYFADFAVCRMTKRFSGSGPRPPENSEDGLNEERRLDDVAIDKVGKIIEVANVVALDFQASTALSKIAKNVFNVGEGILEDKVFHALDLLFSQS